MLDVKFKISEPIEGPSYFISGRCAEVSLDGKVIGYFGEIHPKILKNFKIKMPVVLLEIGLKEIFEKFE